MKKVSIILVCFIVLLTSCETTSVFPHPREETPAEKAIVYPRLPHYK